MAVTSILSISIFILQALALQVTPNSPCASICLDVPGQDISDPNASNTFGTDIVCSDSDYANSTVGQKFVSCLTCLQGSVASSDGENDQGWFLYNLRYALNSCLFNSSDGTTAISTPCSTKYSCGNLQNAIDNGNLVQGNETEFSYCSADNNAIMGSTLSKCISCLQDGGDEKYLANFLIALQAGCMQLPSGAVVIGLQGSIFSDTPVNITSVMKAGTTNTTNTHNSGISQSVVIGIAVAGVAGIIVLMAFLFVCYRKHQRKIRMKRIASPLDPRFGAPNISAPNRGAYGNPQKRMMADGKSMASGGLNSLRSVFARQHPNSKGTIGMRELPVENSHFAGQLPTYNEAVVRAHLAYDTLATSITSAKSVAASKASHQSSSTSSESFPNIQASQAQQEKPRQVQQEQPRRTHQEQPRKALQEQPRKVQQEQPRRTTQEQPRKALQEQPRKAQQTTRPQAQQQQPPKLQQPPAFKLQLPPASKVREAPTARVQQNPRKAQQFHPPSANAPQAQTKQEEALYKGTSTPESQTQPIAAKFESKFASMRRSTIGRGIGNANASTLPRKGETTALSRPAMLDLERLDLELAEYARGGKSRKAKDPTPKSASEGEEQWPGSY